MFRKPLEESIEEMRNMGKHLIPFNYPLNSPQTENDINPLKLKQLTVDGYQILLHYSKADYGDHYLETVQIFGRCYPFLPFHLVVKIARKVLGGYNLSLVEMLRENRKVYCWSVYLDLNGRPIEPPKKRKVEHCIYEGFEYDYLDSNQVNFY